MDPEAEELYQQVQTMIGRPIGAASGVVAPDPVNQPMIRHWAAAFDDWNPVYTDPDAAARSRFGQVVAPPLMLQTWAMATPKLDGIRERGGSPAERNDGDLLSIFDRAGYTGTLASNSEFEFDRYLHLGETVTSANALESVSEQKQTRLGPGFFVTWVTTYRVTTGEEVGRQRFRILKFRPAS